MADLLKSLPYVLENEGGYTNDAEDPGGPTKYGITLGDLSDWRGYRCKADDVKQMGLPEASDIYKAHYWNRCDLDSVISQGVATAIFDVAVNRGVGVAHQYMNEICKQLGKESVNACAPHDFVRLLEIRAEAGYRAIVAHRPSMSVFLIGWLRRAKRMLGLA